MVKQSHWIEEDRLSVIMSSITVGVGFLSIKLYKKPSVSGTQGSMDTRGKGLMEVG